MRRLQELRGWAAAQCQGASARPSSSLELSMAASRCMVMGSSPVILAGMLKDSTVNTEYLQRGTQRWGGGLGKQLRGGRSCSGNASALRTAQTDTPARPPRPLPSSSQGSRSCSGSAARALRVRQSERSNALALVPTQTDGTCSTDELHVRSCQRHVVPVEGKKSFQNVTVIFVFFFVTATYLFYFLCFILYILGRSK